MSNNETVDIPVDTSPNPAEDTSGFGLSDDALTGVYFVSVLFAMIALCICIAYVRNQTKARKIHEISNNLFVDVDTSNWVDVSAYNGGKTVEEGANIDMSEIDNTYGSDRIGDIERNVEGRLPLERIQTKAEFQNMLELFYSKYAPGMSLADIELAADTYFNSRDELNVLLVREYGKSLNSFVARMQRGDRQPRNKIRQRAQQEANTRSEQPSVNFVGEKPMGMTGEGIELTLRTNLKVALERRQMKECFPILNSQGITSLLQLKDMQVSTVRQIIPTQYQDKLLEMIETCQILFIAEMSDNNQAPV